MDESSLKVLNKASGLRNEFVHYKWASRSEKESVQHASLLKTTVAEVERLANDLIALEQEKVWSGREQEIMTQVREDFNNHVAEVGAFSEYLARMAQDTEKNPSESDVAEQS